MAYERLYLEEEKELLIEQKLREIERKLRQEATQEIKLSVAEDYDYLFHNKYAKEIPLTEGGAGLSKIQRYIDEGYPLIFITAYKGCELRRNVNKARHIKLLRLIRNAGYGAIQVVGNDICDDDREVEERGFIVVGKEPSKEEAEKLYDMGMKLIEHFDQWGFLYYDGKRLYSVGKGGIEKELSVVRFTLSDIGRFWSRLKGKKFSFPDKTKIVLIRRMEGTDRFYGMYHSLSGFDVRFFLWEYKDIKKAGNILGG